MKKTIPIAMSLVIAAIAATHGEAQLTTTLQLPTFGVAIDAHGTLEVKAFPDPKGQLRAKRLAAAKQALDADVQAKSKLRKVSLVRIEQAVRECLAAGKPLDESLQVLAGLQRVQYVFCYPEQGDIVIAGPAEGWMPDGAGRMIGLTTGQPTLELQDLVVALRMFAPGKADRPFIGCTIDPSQEGLARLTAFQKTIPRTVPERARASVAKKIEQGTRDALGMSNIRVFGISPNTHFARVLVEADHRMKRIGIGLEPPPIKMATFLGTLRSARNGTLQRWWFQPHYDSIKVTKDRLGMELAGQGVQLLAEDLAIGPGGNLINPTARVNQASRLFTTSFTKKYPEIAAASPVYAQMRNCIDCLLAAAYLQREDFYGHVGWRMSTLGDEKAVPTQLFAAPKQVACNVNVIWKGSRLLSPAGGVSVQPHLALTDERIQKDADGKLGKSYQALGDSMAKERWWWD
jgi:hypothetical protein